MTYYALNHSDFDSMSAIAKALYRQQVKGSIRGHGVDMFCRAFKAFDIRMQHLNTIQISDTSTVVTKAREIVRTHVLGEKNATSTSPVAKKVNGTKYKTSARA